MNRLLVQSRRSTRLVRGLPYDSVHAAIIDGWRVIQAPDVWAGIGTEGAGEVIGFQFILEKIEDFGD